MTEVNRAGVTPIQIAVTEEGQRVAWDGWAWQRRELTKVLPPSTTWPAEEQLPDVLAQHGLSGAVAAAPIRVPAQICPDVYLVGSWPNHTYIIDCAPAGLALIDPGLTSNHPTVMDNIAALGVADRRVRWVLNTHAHFDHSMADDLFRADGAEVCVGTADAEAVEHGTSATANYLMPEILANYPTTTVDRRLNDGDVLALGPKRVQVIGTPGHTPGHVCFTLQSGNRQVLFSGDTVLHDDRLGWQESPYADNDAYKRSLDRLARYGGDACSETRWDLLLPGHGTLVLDNAQLDVNKASQAVNRHLAEGTAIPALPFADPDYRRRMYGRVRSSRSNSLGVGEMPPSRGR